MATALSVISAEPRQIGYARVSTFDQTTQQQLDALRASGCLEIYEETATGRHDERAKLNEMIAGLRPGDVVVVWKLDRLSRSLGDLIRLIETIGKAGAGFKSLTEAIDTTTAAGRLMMHMVGAFAEFERSLIVERTRAGQEPARRQGKRMGRPRKLTPGQEREAVRQVTGGQATAADMARLFGVHRSTIGEILARAKANHAC